MPPIWWRSPKPKGSSFYVWVTEVSRSSLLPWLDRFGFDRRPALLPPASRLSALSEDVEPLALMCLYGLPGTSFSPPPTQFRRLRRSKRSSRERPVCRWSISDTGPRFRAIEMSCRLFERKSLHRLLEPLDWPIRKSVERRPGRRCPSPPVPGYSVRG